MQTFLFSFFLYSSFTYASPCEDQFLSVNDIQDDQAAQSFLHSYLEPRSRLVLLGDVFGAAPTTPVHKILSTILAEIVAQKAAVLTDGDRAFFEDADWMQGGELTRIVPSLNAPQLAQNHGLRVGLRSAYARLKLILELNKDAKTTIFAHTSSAYGLAAQLMGAKIIWVENGLSQIPVFLPRGRFSGTMVEDIRTYEGKNITTFAAMRIILDKFADTLRFGGKDARQVIDKYLNGALKDSAKSERYVQRLSTLNSFRSAYGINKELTLFGSKELWKDYEPLVASVVGFFAAQGYAIKTGGAGGFMALANEIAKKGFAPSIGIPIVKKDNKNTEVPAGETPQFDLHDLTMPVDNYDQRLGLLIDGSEVFLIAPGRHGTLREIATLLVEMEGRLQTINPGPLPQVFFLSSIYFDELVSWIKRFPIDKRILANLHVVHDQKDVQKVLLGF